MFTIHRNGGHLGHVIWIIYIKFLFPFPMRCHMNFDVDWPRGFREEDV